jgi:hypothetical protein
LTAKEETGNRSLTLQSSTNTPGSKQLVYINMQKLCDKNGKLEVVQAKGGIFSITSRNPAELISIVGRGQTKAIAAGHVKMCPPTVFW